MLPMCVMLLVLTVKDLKELKKEGSRQNKRFGTYFEELRENSGSKAIYLYHLWFMLRRAALVGLAIFGNPTFQVLSFWFLSHLNLIYLIYTKPF